MINMDNLARVNAQADSVTARFVEKIKAIDLRLALAVPAAIGCAIALYGVGQEVAGQSHLLQQGGIAALDSYLDAMKSAPVDGVWQYVREAFSGQHQSFGGNAQGIGTGVIAGATPIAAAAVVLARGFEQIQNFIQKGGEELRSKMGSLNSETSSAADALAAFRRGAGEAFRASADAEQLAPVTPARPKM